MSANNCSLALDIEELNVADNDLEDTLTLLVNKHYVSIVDSSSSEGSSFDVVEFGGTITVSF